MVTSKIPRKKDLERKVREEQSKNLKKSDFDGDTLCIVQQDHKGKWHIVKK